MAPSIREQTEAVEKLAQRIHKGYIKVRTRKPVSHYQDFMEPVPTGSRKRVRSLSHLSIAERTDIVHRILIKHEK